MLKKKRSPFEIFVITILVILCLALGIGIFAGRTRVQKGRLLMQELSMLRSSVSLFSVLNGRLPKSLDELKDSKYTVDDMQKPYIEFFNDSNQSLVDPFGNPYAYDSSKGWVSSKSDGYERW